MSDQVKYKLPPIPDQHRTESSKLILHAADMVTPGSVLILGVGRAQEIPLAELAERFGKIVLNDIDGAAIEAELATLPLSPAARAKIELAPADLTGATDSLAKSAVQTLEIETDPAAGANALAALLEVPRPPVVQLAEKFDLVIASCIVSQLHVPATERLQEAFVTKFPGQLETLQKSVVWLTALARYAQRTEASLVSSLAALVSPAGRIVFSESVQAVFFEVGENGEWLAEGTHRMLRTVNLVELLDSRFRVYTKSRWNWVILPTKGTKRGRAFDVQGLIVGLNSSSS